MWFGLILNYFHFWASHCSWNRRKCCTLSEVEQHLGTFLRSVPQSHIAGGNSKYNFHIFDFFCIVDCTSWSALYHWEENGNNSLFILWFQVSTIWVGCCRRIYWWGCSANHECFRFFWVCQNSSFLWRKNCINDIGKRRYWKSCLSRRCGWWDEAGRGHWKRFQNFLLLLLHLINRIAHLADSHDAPTKAEDKAEPFSQKKVDAQQRRDEEANKKQEKKGKREKISIPPAATKSSVESFEDPDALRRSGAFWSFFQNISFIYCFFAQSEIMKEKGLLMRDSCPRLVVWEILPKRRARANQKNAGEEEKVFACFNLKIFTFVCHPIQGKQPKPVPQPAPKTMSKAMVVITQEDEEESDAEEESKQGKKQGCDSVFFNILFSSLLQLLCQKKTVIQVKRFLQRWARQWLNKVPKPVNCWRQLLVWRLP